MLNTATVAMAGRTSGRTRRKKIVYSEPVDAAGVLQVAETWRMNSDRMKTASGRPCAV
jgi:hypothetical protein